MHLLDYKEQNPQDPIEEYINALHLLREINKKTKPKEEPLMNLDAFWDVGYQTHVEELLTEQEYKEKFVSNLGAYAINDSAMISLETKLTEKEVKVLERGGFDLRLRKQRTKDPIVQSNKLYAEILRKSYTLEQVARIMGVKDSRILKLLVSKPPSLYGIFVDSRWYIPKFQFYRNRPIPGIETIFGKIGDEINPISFYKWFLTPNTDLVVDEGLDTQRNYSPRDWMIKGNSVEIVAQFAEDL